MVVNSMSTYIKDIKPGNLLSLPTPAWHRLCESTYVSHLQPI